jgi:hypothetical protein
MCHWIRELSNREDSLGAKKNDEVGRLAYNLVHECVMECLELYNKRHGTQNAIQPKSTDDGRRFSIFVGSGTFGFEFARDSPKFMRYRSLEGKQLQDQGEVRIDDEGRMHFLINENMMTLQSVVRGALQPALFPTFTITKEEGTPDFQSFLGR